MFLIQGESRETGVFKEDKTLRIFQQKFYNVHKNIHKTMPLWNIYERKIMSDK